MPRIKRNDEPTHNPPSDERILSYEDLQARGIKLTKGALWKLMKRGKFPKAIKVGLQNLGWLETEINQYIGDRIAARKDT
jgi:prophage regulatory protein